MPRPERSLDPHGGPAQALAAQLRDLRRHAGNPGYRELAKRVGYSASALANAAGGRQLPSLAVTLAFAQGCGAETVEWEQRWRQAAADYTRMRSPGLSSDDGGDAAGAPYRGLAGYRVGDADWYFGREQLVTQVIDRVCQQRFVAVFGVSGSGKSSLLHAGLVPAMTGDGSREHVSTVEAAHPEGVVPVLVRPGSDPRAVLRRAVAAAPDDRDLLVVVDQFEEMFTLCHDAAEHRGYVADLAALASETSRTVRVVLGVRADFYARCLEILRLAELFTDASLAVGPLTEDELRQVIIGPARQAGLSVERALVTKILADAAGQPGALPLVSHALLETWRQRRGTVLTEVGYEATGAIAGAIAQTAEAVYQGFDDAQRETARQVLTRLVAVGDGVVDTRRRASRTELQIPHAQVVLDAFAAARLVVLGEDDVELAHEALISAWPRLYDWLHTERAWLRTRRDLTDAANLWESLRRDPDLLYRGTRLTTWNSRSHTELVPRELAFLTASLTRQQHETTQRRRRTTRTIAAAIATTITLGAVTAAALQQGHQADRERDIALSRQLTNDARTQLSIDPELALLLARHAYQLTPNPHTETLLRQATENSRIIATWHVQKPVSNLRFSPDARLLATTDTERHVQVRQRSTGRTLLDLPDAGHLVAFSPDGRRLATAGRGVNGTMAIIDLAAPTDLKWIDTGLLYLQNLVFPFNGPRVLGEVEDRFAAIVWDARTGARMVRPPVPPGQTIPWQLSPDGTMMTAEHDDGTTQLHRLDAAIPPTLLHKGPEPVPVAITPDGSKFAVADGKIQVASTTGSGPPVTIPNGTSDGVGHMTFSPDGARLAFSLSNHIHIWDATGQGKPMILRGHTDTISDITFSADGRYLATGSHDHTIRIWDTIGQEPQTLLASTATPTQPPALSADSASVATTDTTGVIQVVGTGRISPAVAFPAGSAKGLRKLAVSGHGNQVAGIHQDGSVRIWRSPTDSNPHTRRCDHTDFPGGRVSKGLNPPPVMDIAVSPDGAIAAGACLHGNVHVWDTATGKQRTALPNAHPGEFSLRFSSNGKLLAAFDDISVALWSVERLDLPPRRVYGNIEEVRDIAFAANADRLAIAGLDGTIRVTQAPHDGSTTLVRSQSDPFNAVAISPDGTTLATTDPTGEAIQIHQATGETEPIVISTPRPHYRSLAFDTDGRHIITTHADGTVRRWLCEVCGPITTVLNLSTTRTTRQLTPQEQRRFLQPRN